MPRNPLVPALLAVTVSALVVLVGAPPATGSGSGDVRGPVTITPESGTDETPFSGKVEAECADTTVEGAFAVTGPGSDYLTAGEGSLVPGAASTFTGGDLAWFTYASVANLRTATATSFVEPGTYVVGLYCFSPAPDGGITLTDRYETALEYTPADGGAWRVATPGAGVPPERFVIPAVADPQGLSGSGEGGTAGGTAAPPSDASPGASAPGGPVPSREAVPDGEPSATATAGAPDGSWAVASEAPATGERAATAGEDGRVPVGTIVVVVLLVAAAAVVAALVVSRRRRNAHIDSLGSRGGG